jgi:hypothetical protein
MGWATFWAILSQTHLVTLLDTGNGANRNLESENFFSRKQNKTLKRRQKVQCKNKSRQAPILGANSQNVVLVYKQTLVGKKVGNAKECKITTAWFSHLEKRFSYVGASLGIPTLHPKERNIYIRSRLLCHGYFF